MTGRNVAPPRSELRGASAPLDSTRGAPRLKHEPGLDGLRGLAVIGVLCFHGGFSWMVGGYLGVSLFFTLSGFLITSLLLAEIRANGRVALGTFWLRRFRRLGPAALLTIAGLCVFAATVATASQRAALRADLWAALGQFANWRFVLQGHSYADLFRDPSPVAHFWSLAIEEQFYLIFPPLVTVIAWAAGPRHARARLTAVLAILATASIFLALVIDDPDRIYYGTDTRAFELLAGALLACWATRARPAGRLASTVGVLVAVAVGVAWVRTGQSSAWLYQGGLAVVALSSVALIRAACAPGPVRWVCSRPPLRAIGLVSYGLYLFHWPVFLWLDELRTGLRGWPLFLVRLAVTGLFATISYLLVERPIRYGVRVTGTRFIPAYLGAAVLLAIAVPISVVPPSRDDPTAVADFDEVHAIIESATRGEASSAASDTSAASAANQPVTPDGRPLVDGIPRPLRTYVVGDSTGAIFSAGAALWSLRTGLIEVRNAAWEFCGFGYHMSVTRPDNSGGRDTPEYCNERPQVWQRDLGVWRADVILVVSGPMNFVNFRHVGVAGGAWTSIDTPEGKAFFREGMAGSAAALEAAAPGVPILWFDSPYIERRAFALGRARAWADPARVDAYNALVAELAASHPQVLRLDWAAHFDRLAIDEDARLRPDGIHVPHTILPGLLDSWGWDLITTAYELSIPPSYANP